MNRSMSAGFSLIEILIALTLLGLAGTFVAGKVFDMLHEGRVKAAKIQMNSLAERMKEFRRHCNFYPTTDQGLEALVTKPTGGRECKNYNPSGYLENNVVPKDPWDNDYVYESDGSTFNMHSFGDDGTEGGEGKGADIYLYEKSAPKSE
ncbi:MAG: type II secretion system major pseudopilin GspG [Pseudomonadota bacterium]